MNHGTHMNMSWYKYERGMSHVGLRHGTYMSEAWHTYECVMAHI